jgi:cation diffusion facilitator CzcD-associated flavoprotein CzcO
MPDGTQHPAALQPDALDTDIVIVGAGLSGIGAACRIARQARRARFVILESRDTIGGTWDLFRYPGVRSDSDMHTLGYKFRPWRSLVSLAPAADILDYIRDTASHYDIERHIRFRQTLRAAAWSSRDARWTLDIQDANTGHPVRLTCNILLMCSGYYSYAEGHAPHFPGQETFRGQLIHPQFWPETLETEGKRIVVIGSGATAVTLVPALARTAAHVTMLQRSPTYVVSRPNTDRIAERLSRSLPPRLAGRLTRIKNIAETMFFYRLARKNPADTKRRILGMIRRELGPDFDVARHFTPTYNPWDQRLCLVPDADLFKALADGSASIETDHIDRFTERSILLKSGRELSADIIVSATGLKLIAMGGAAITVDGRPVEFGRTMAYKGMMLGGVPNFVFVVGYTNASWTLKSDLVASYVCRLLNFMRRRRYDIVVAPSDPAVRPVPLLDFTSGYVQRASDILPKQGDRAPWRLRQNYLRDMLMLRHGALRDGTISFARRPGALPLDPTKGKSPLGSQD